MASFATRCSSALVASFAIVRAVCSGRSSTKVTSSVDSLDVLVATTVPSSRVRKDPTIAASTNVSNPRAMIHCRDFMKVDIDCVKNALRHYTAHVRDDSTSPKQSKVKGRKMSACLHCGLQRQVNATAPNSRHPIRNKNIGFMRGLRVPVRRPYQLFPIGAEHRKSIEPRAVGNLLQMPALQIHRIQFKVSHSAGRSLVRRENDFFAIGEK